MSRAHIVSITIVMVLQLVSAVWLVKRGRHIGYFFGLFALFALGSLV
jgi:hypothetical protein